MDFFRSIYSYTQFWLNQTLFVFEKTSVTPLSILRFLIIFFLTIWLASFVLKTLTSLAQNRRAIERSLMYRITRLIYYLILGIGLVIALASFGFDFSNFALIAGALGVGLGFGLQNIFNNFLSGIILLFESQIKIGDYIELESGAKGEIREIHFRNTILKTNDGTDIIVPNSQMINTRIVNWTLNDPYRRIRIPFSVVYGSDKELVAQVIIEAAKKVPFTLKKNKPDPAVYLTKLGENGLEFELIVWINEKANTHNRSVMSEYLWTIDTTLYKNHIDIPIVRREVHLLQEKKS
jgi:potassium efflux system protein